MGGNVIDPYFRSLNDVWQSVDNGKTWIQVNGGAPWTSRCHMGAILFSSGTILLMGGRNNYQAFNDVWQSPDGGRSWSLVITSASWDARSHFSTALTKSGKVLIVGGSVFGIGPRDRFLP